MLNSPTSEETFPSVMEEIGNYRIVRKLSQGGMGAVYLAEHAVIGRPAAVKLLLPTMSNSVEPVQRFLNEARAAAAIRHPGIVEILDCGRLSGGQPYIVMEYLEGETLGAYLKRHGRLANQVGTIRAIIRQIADALSATHNQGIVHRDLKPDNVFLSSEAGIANLARIKILDFGIAKLMLGGPAAALTSNRELLGTPIYLSPEQCQGSRALDHRTDIYALGCIAFELVTGGPLFAGESIGEILAAHMFAEPPRLLMLEPSLPPAFADLIVKMVSKSPDARPRSMADVVAAIDEQDPAAVESSLNRGRVVLPSGFEIRFELGREEREPHARLAAASPDDLSGWGPVSGDPRPTMGLAPLTPTNEAFPAERLRWKVIAASAGLLLVAALAWLAVRTPPPVGKAPEAARVDPSTSTHPSALAPAPATSAQGDPSRLDIQDPPADREVTVDPAPTATPQPNAAAPPPPERTDRAGAAAAKAPLGKAKARATTRPSDGATELFLEL